MSTIWFPVVCLRLRQKQIPWRWRPTRCICAPNLEYHKLRTRKAGHIRHIDMHLVVPKQMSVESGHALSHQISRAIEQRLSYSYILVHVEPCLKHCDDCGYCLNNENLSVLTNRLFKGPCEERSDEAICFKPAHSITLSFAWVNRNPAAPSLAVVRLRWSC